ncbi:MAG: hypothetical protein V4555_10370 [Acidobacteriota bacterium]
MAFMAIWRPESNGDWKTDMTLAEFKARDVANRAAGLALVCLRHQLTELFAAVWLPGTGHAPWVVGFSHTAFLAHNADMVKKGFRLVDLQMVNPIIGVITDGDIGDIQHSRFTATWRSGSGAQEFRDSMTHQQLLDHDATFRGQGLELLCLRTQNDGNRVGLWRPGSGGKWTSPQYPQDFKATDATHTSNGLRLIDADTLDGSKICGVWHPGTGSVEWGDEMSTSQLHTSDAVQRKANLRIVKIIPMWDPVFPFPPTAESGGLPPGTPPSP